MGFDDLVKVLREEISNLLVRSETQFAHIEKPHVVMVVGVNGVGKTTTIGKLAIFINY